MLLRERVVLFCGILLLTATLGGCQRGPTWNLAPVEGTVTKNGRPLRSIQVVFVADPNGGTVGPKSSGVTDESGHYRLHTDNGDEGAVVGKYRVVLLDLKAAQEQMARVSQGSQSKEATPLSPEIAKRLEKQRKTAADAQRIPSKYTSINETPLWMEVRPDEQVLDLKVK